MSVARHVHASSAQGRGTAGHSESRAKIGQAGAGGVRGCACLSGADGSHLPSGCWAVRGAFAMNQMNVMDRRPEDKAGGGAVQRSSERQRRSGEGFGSAGAQEGRRVGG